MSLLELSPVLAYDHILGSLPPGMKKIWVVGTALPSDSKYGELRRLYTDGVRHVLLGDLCSNALWMRREKNGEAAFEQPRRKQAEGDGSRVGPPPEDLGRNPVHFGQMFKNEWQRELIHAVNLLPYDDKYFGGEFAGTGKCRQCAGT